NGVLRVAVYDGTQWTYQVLDGDGGPGGQVVGDMADPSVIVDSHDNLIRLYYFDQIGCRLRETFSGDGLSWGHGTLDGSGSGSGQGQVTSCVGARPSAAFDPSTGPRVFYYDSDNGNLRAAKLDYATGWSFSNVDGHTTTNGRESADVGYWSAALIDEN